MIIIRLILAILLSALTVALAWTEETTEQRALLNSGDISVTQQDLRQQLMLLPDAERGRVLAGSSMLKDFLRRVYQNKHMTITAERLKLDEDPLVKARLIAERQRILAEALREHTRKQIQLPDFAALAREHYAARRDEFQLPEQFKASHILKKVQCDCERAEKRQALEQLRARLQSGEDFAKLASTESDDKASAERGGELDRWFKRDELTAPFVDALDKLQTGQISDVVETQFGFHLIKKLDHQATRLQNFDEVREILESRLRESYLKEQLVGRAVSYLPPPEVKFDESALESVLASH